MLIVIQLIYYCALFFPLPYVSIVIYWNVYSKMCLCVCVRARVRVCVCTHIYVFTYLHVIFTQKYQIKEYLIVYIYTYTLYITLL